MIDAAKAATEILNLINSSPRTPSAAEIEVVICQHCRIGEPLKGAQFALEVAKDDTIYTLSSEGLGDLGEEIRKVEKHVGGVLVADWQPSASELHIFVRIDLAARELTA